MAILTVGAHDTAADRVVHYAFVPYRSLLGSSMFNQFSRRSICSRCETRLIQSNDGKFSRPRAPLAVHELCSQQHRHLLAVRPRPQEGGVTGAWRSMGGRGRARRPQHKLQPTSAGRSACGTLSGGEDLDPRKAGMGLIRPNLLEETRGHSPASRARSLASVLVSVAAGSAPKRLAFLASKARVHSPAAHAARMSRSVQECPDARS